MFWDLVIIILCINAFLGFISYGMGFANGFIITTEKNNKEITIVTKILFLIFCISFGFFAFWGTYHWSDKKGLEFW